MKFNFVQANEIYIDIVIKKLKNKSSYGYDFISNKHIKYARSVLTKALVLLIIPCLHTGIHQGWGQVQYLYLVLVLEYNLSVLAVLEYLVYGNVTARV